MISKRNITEIPDNVPYGIYVWHVDGKLLVNEDGDPLRINSMRGDLKRISQISAAARHYGFPDGEPVFVEGRRAISTSEYEHQLERHLNGELADEYDIPALAEKARREKAGK